MSYTDADVEKYALDYDPQDDEGCIVCDEIDVDMKTITDCDVPEWIGRRICGKHWKEYLEGKKVE